MSQPNPINISFLHTFILQESENEAIQKLDPNFYKSLSKFIGNLKSDEYDGIEAKMKNTLLSMATDMASLLLKLRLGKADLTNANQSMLLDEEKYILDSQEEMAERKGIILSGILNGKTKLVESITKNHKTKLLVVRFLQETDQLTGSDLKKYGPFKQEDIASIPYDNAQDLISKNIAAKIRWDD